MSNVPTTQRAAVRVGQGLTALAPVKTVPVEKPGPDQILVKITWTGLCASDKSLLHDEWSALGFAMPPMSHYIAGHEGAGSVVAVGENVAKSGLWKLGDRAGIKWIADVCGTCHFCKESDQGGEVLCTNQINSGFSTAGTFQEYVVTSAKYATRIPDGVLDEEAGPIMCGGVTAYTGLKRSNVRPGQWVVIIGAGGGLGHLGVQYARAMGMRVVAIDGGEAKRDLCLKLGAEKYLDFTQSKDLAADVLQITDGLGAHGVVVYAAVKAGYAIAPQLARSGGTIVAVGFPPDTNILLGLPPMTLGMKKLNLVGSYVGPLKDADEALGFTARGLVHPILTKGKLEDVDKFIDLMIKGEVAGRVVLQVSA